MPSSQTAASPLAPPSSHTAVRGGWLVPIVIGIVGTLAVLFTKDAPGLTSDEPFSVSYGKLFVYTALATGRGFFEPHLVQETFMGRSEHPPLGRWLVGWAHWLSDARPRDPLYFDVRAARTAPAIAFGLMIVLVSRVASRWGKVASASAGVGLGTMPRVFGHAHFAALDTFVALTYLAAVITAGWMFAGPRPARRSIVAGVVWGLALLTKLHGVLVAPLVACWAIWHYRTRAVWPLVCWSACGTVVFFLGWPWLWYDTGIRLANFVSSGVARQITWVWYLGRSFADVDVPWHYPWVLVGVTIPVGLLALLVAGFAWWGRRQFAGNGMRLIVAAAAFPLVLFSLPGVPVYDGVRLFLMVFPFLAVVIGWGTAAIFDRLKQQIGVSAAIVAVAVLLASQAVGLVRYHPCHLSYYNTLVGGLAGAERLGFQVTYWGDSLTPEFLDRWSRGTPNGAKAILAPTLYKKHELLYATVSMTRRQQSFVPDGDASARYLVVYNRRPYVSDELLERIRRLPPAIARVERDGVWLAAAYRLLPAESEPKP